MILFFLGKTSFPRHKNGEHPIGFYFFLWNLTCFFFNMKIENKISANKFGTQQKPSVSPAVHVCTKADIGRDLMVWECCLLLRCLLVNQNRPDFFVKEKRIGTRQTTPMHLIVVWCFFFCFFLSESWEEIPAILLFWNFRIKRTCESKGPPATNDHRTSSKCIHGIFHAGPLLQKKLFFLGTKILVLSAARKLTNTVSRPNASGSVIEKSGAFLRINRNLYGNEAWNMKSPKGGDFQGVRLWIIFTSQKLQKLKVLSREVAKLSEGCCFHHRIDWELQLRVAGI